MVSIKKIMKSVINWEKAIINVQYSIIDAIGNLNKSKLQISIVVDPDGCLIGTITDGDIRRGLLQGFDLKDSVSKILTREAIVTLSDVKSDQIMQTMQTNQILQMPIVDRDSKVVGLYVWDTVNSNEASKDNMIVIMAGGFGTRLRPYTEDRPKPMLLVNEKPILEHIITNAKLEGFHKFIISTYYLADVIEDYFGDGKKWGVEINYVRETSPLGTSGALSLIEARPSESFIVTNGDVLTDISYSNILDFHTQQSSFATMAVRKYELQNPFGVVQVDGIDITGFEEKPVIKSNINAGVYVLKPGVLDCIKKNTYIDMPNLFEILREDGKTIKAYLVHEEWIDIARYNDLIKANNILHNGKFPTK
jgi:dTDP-glucose pyrophosphorylase/predicted transcriptional regulator